MAHIRGELATIPLSQALTNLDSSAQGLTAAQAETRLRRYEPNEIAERHRNPVLVFLGYFWAPIPWMIKAALVLSLAARHWTDALIIAVLLAMNSLVDFAEEHQAANAITALKQRLAASARVLRDGAWATVAARELVPGDVVRVRIGDVIPADLHHDLIRTMIYLKLSVAGHLTIFVNDHVKLAAYHWLDRRRRRSPQQHHHGCRNVNASQPRE